MICGAKSKETREENIIVLYLAHLKDIMLFVSVLDPYFLAFTPLLPSNRPIYNQLSHRECFIYLHDHYNDVYFRKITDKLKTLSIDVPICWEY